VQKKVSNAEAANDIETTGKRLTIIRLYAKGFLHALKAKSGKTQEIEGEPRMDGEARRKTLPVSSILHLLKGRSKNRKLVSRGGEIREKVAVVPRNVE